MVLGLYTRTEVLLFMRSNGSNLVSGFPNDYCGSKKIVARFSSEVFHSEHFKEVLHVLYVFFKSVGSLTYSPCLHTFS